MPGYFNVGFSWDSYGPGNVGSLFITCNGIPCLYATNWASFRKQELGLNADTGPLGAPVAGNFRPGIQTKLTPYDRFSMVGESANDLLVSMNVGFQAMAWLGGYPAGILFNSSPQRKTE